MLCVRSVSRVCRQTRGTHAAAPVAPTALSLRQRVRTAASGTALVVGGGFAGLAAADVLVTAGMDVVLLEQGRGLGGRMCSRTVTLGSHGERVTFDHGCQYLTARNPLFDAALADLQQRGALAQWSGGLPVGAASLAEDGTVDMSTFAADTSKALWVGNPTNSAVGRALAARAGPRLSAITATRVEQLSWHPHRRAWTCRARRAGSSSGGSSSADAAIAELESTSFDCVVTAMSSVSTARLLGASSSTSTSGGEAGGGSDPLAPQVVEAAEGVRSNVCWAVMVALNRKIDVPFDGALLSRPGPGPDGGPQYGPIAWLARDSSKPGRPAVAGGAGEAWVLHGGPDWSNARRDVAPADVAAELLRDFAHLVQTPLSSADVVHLEAHRWNNAYPLNPRPPQAVQPQLQPQPAEGGSAAAAVPLGGHFMLRPEMRLAACGDWCKGPRAADAYLTGWEAATALLRL
ncbi:hypothetical protein PLESTB_000533600 [Pleodorina starrii]|uniref:Amine oxidase n=1 Tax=Pleodorina starrii TaxID=330485 RepID=A0A9W6BGQ3_9CHLO|nr:hypothetical protein PLESTM_000397800 [Pleodorina starrii]GLC51729.1 hypothetical protein PLESTB_000533600 [Pleodorina starrii]